MAPRRRSPGSPASSCATRPWSAALSTTPLRGHDTKSLMRSLLTAGVDLTNLQLDTAIAAYLLDPAEARYDLVHLVERYTSFSMPVDSPAAKGQLDLDGATAEPPTIAGRAALAVHQLVAPISTSLRRSGHGRPVRHDREPAGARAGTHGARRGRRRPGRAAPALRAADRRGPTPAGRAEGGRRAGRPEHQLADPAARAAVRRAAGRAWADGGEADEDRGVDGRRDAGEAARRVAGVHRPAAAVPGGREAARHVRRGLDRRGGIGRSHPRHVQPDRRPHRATQLGPPEPAQHPGAPRRGSDVPPGLHPRARQRAAGRRLQPDRAALHRPPRRRPGPRRRLHRPAGHPQRDGRHVSSVWPLPTSHSTSGPRRRWSRTGWPTAWRPTGSASA